MVALSGNRHSLRGDIVFTFVLIAVGYLAWLARDVLIMLYVSALFAVILTPLVHSTARLRIGRWYPLKGSRALLFLLLALAGAIAAYISFAIPPVVRDLENLSGSIPTRVPAILARIKSLPFASHLNMAQVTQDLQTYASRLAATTLLSIRSWAGKLADVAMGFILTAYFILEGDQAYRWSLSFVPADKRARLEGVLERAGVRMGRWLLGQGSLMLILGVTSTIVFASLHIRYAYALGVLTGLLNIIPVLGAAISIAIVLLVAIFDSWGKVLGVAIFYVVYIQVENSYLTPRIMQSRVHLPGIAVIVSLLLGFAIEGILGAMVAVPTAALVALLLEEYLQQSATGSMAAEDAPARDMH